METDADVRKQIILMLTKLQTFNKLRKILLCSHHETIRKNRYLITSKKLNLAAKTPSNFDRGKKKKFSTESI